VKLARCHDEVLRLLELENPPCCVDILRGVAPVSFGVQVAKLDRLLQTNGDSVLTISTDWATVRGLIDSRAGTSLTNTQPRQLFIGVQAIPTVR
jgi:hypothetical protein